MTMNEASPPAQDWLPELEPGPYAVGYRQQWFEDPTRSIPDPWAGTTSKRPILLNVWYPSEAGEVPSGETMLVDDYLQIDVEGGGPWRARLEAHVRQVRAAEVFDGEPTDALAELVTAARRDGSWAPGRFPLVLVHPGLGGSFSDNFVVWEHLAAHGFVVVSGAFVDASGLSSAIEWDPATSIADLDRMFEAAATWPGVDPSRTTVIGHSYGAQAAIAYALAGRDIRAVVSLDSTLEYADADAPWYEQAEPARYLGQRERLRVPALIVYAGGQTGYVEGLVHSDRILIREPGLKHNDFIAHGGILRAGYTMQGEAEVRARFVEVVDAVRVFLGKVSGEARPAGAELVGDGRPWAAGESLPPNWTHLPARAPAPDLVLILTWIREQGPALAYSRCAAHEDCEPEVMLNEAGYVLLRGGAHDDADAVFALIVEQAPDSWNAWDSWAEVSARRGELQTAIERYRKALELVQIVEGGGAPSPGVVHSERIEARLVELEEKLH